MMKITAERPQPGAGQRRHKTRVPMISHSIRAVTLATLFAVTMFAAGTSALAASFDGPWSVTVVTRSGPCDQAYRYGVTISRGVVSYAGGGPVSLTGRVSPSGNVTVRVSSGPQYAVGSGRLSRSTGGGSRPGPRSQRELRGRVEREPGLSTHGGKLHSFPQAGIQAGSAFAGTSGSWCDDS